MKKVEKIVLPIVALLLVAAAIVGMVALYKNVDKVFKEEETTSESSSTQKPADTSSSTPSDTTASTTTNYYFDEENGTGYRTISGKTYFFKKIVTEGSNIRQYDCVFKKYSSYEVIPYLSTDTLNWTFKENIEQYDENLNLIDQDEYFFFAGTNCYVTYTVIDGCSNPLYVLSDLNANVFFDNYFFKLIAKTGLG